MRVSTYKRSGSVLPLMAVSLVAVFGFVALAIDLGMVALARTQYQNAADAAAMAGARTLDGSTSGHISAATANATNAAVANPILSGTIAAGQVAVQHGSYHYNSSGPSFVAQIPPLSPDNYNLTQVTINGSASTAFARVLSLTSTNMTVTAQAAHRPRDVAIVLDFSGSMNNESDLWNCESYLGSMVNTPNNGDPTFPQFGVYNPAFSSQALLQCSSTDPRVGLCNVTQTVSGVPPIVNDFYQNSRGAGAASAFAPAPSSVTNTQPGGDNYLNAQSSSSPAVTWQDITGSASTTFAGYPSFNGYTQGPGYWGKTFFIWPPDPRPANDWRKKFFTLPAGTPVNDDRALWDSSGNWLDPPGNYIINYAAVLNWIQNTPNNPFPSMLRSGNVLFYDQIPNDVPASAYDHTQPNSNIADSNQRFWKEYIDFVFGVWRDPFGAVQHPGSSTCSYGPDFACGNATGIQITGPDAPPSGGGAAWINSLDNPRRPRHRFWFGPMTMIQYMLDTGLLPGTAHDISMIPAKMGISGALQDIQNNHPNDLVSIVMYGRPGFAGDPAGVASFSAPQSSLGKNYTAMINGLWYAPNSGTADVRPWDANGSLAPRAHGDYCSNTSTSYGLMLAYNQFSGSTTLQAQGMGGLGRQGAQKLVILETDGMANTATSAATTSGGAYNSYFNVGPSYSYSLSSADPAQDAVNVATRICALDSDTSGIPGYATARKPVLIHCIAFGAIFEPTAAGSATSQAVSLLQQVSTIGNTVFPGSAGDPTNGYKWCIGTLSQRQADLQQAFTNIMDGTVSIVLVK